MIDGQSASCVTIDGHSASQVLVSSPISGPRPDFCYCQIVADLSVWGSCLDEWTGLSFTVVIASNTCHLYFAVLHVGILYSQSRTVWLLEDIRYLQIYW
jgi:hypothetical protein